MIKFKRVNGVGNVAHVAETENLTERDHLKGIDINGRIILKLIFNNEHEIADWTELTQAWNMWRVVNCCNEIWCLINLREILDWLRNIIF